MDVITYSKQYLTHLGFLQGLEFVEATALGMATSQYIMYLEYLHDREKNGY